MNNLVELIKRHEGFSDHLYLCPTGHLTIGYGHNCEAHGDAYDYKDRTITIEEAEELLADDILDAVTNCNSYIQFFSKLSEVRQAVLIDMTYNMGIGTLLKFKKMLEAMRVGDWKNAAREMYRSRWARQTDREGELMFMTLTDEWF